MAKRWAPMLVALLVAANGLTAGASLDDWMHHALVHGELAKRAWWDLFNFADGRPETMSDLISRGPFPWFTLPELKLRFFRPLSSALLQLDTLVFKDALWLAHVHSTLWYLGLVALCRALYRRLVPAVALLAAVLFALDDSHTMPVVWLANRNSLISVAFAWLGLWAHLRWREDAWKPGAPLSWLAYVTALLAGETGIAAMAYVVAYELIGRRDSESFGGVAELREIDHEIGSIGAGVEHRRTGLFTEHGERKTSDGLDVERRSDAQVPQSHVKQIARPVGLSALVDAAVQGKRHVVGGGRVRSATIRLVAIVEIAKRNADNDRENDQDRLLNFSKMTEHRKRRREGQKRTRLAGSAP